jgi:ADP-heptose:LPS heptosyltransferase
LTTVNANDAVLIKRDHKNLLFAYELQIGKMRHMKWQESLNKYTYQISHIKRKKNMVADCLLQLLDTVESDDLVCKLIVRKLMTGESKIALWWR